MELPETAITNEQAALLAIQAYCGWHVAPVKTETITLSTGGAALIQLPSLHVTKVEAIKEHGSDITDMCDWAKEGLIRRRSGRFTKRLSGVEVTFTHGYTWDEVPDLISVYGALKERAALPSTPFRSQTAGIYSVTAATVGGVPLAGNTLLLEPEKEVLNRYRLVWGP